MTRLVRFSNNAVSKLASAITAGSTTISLQAGDGSKFPTLTGTQFFMATLVKSDGTTEVVKVTARTGDTLTVVRAAEAVGGVQTAYAFSSGDRIEHRLTAKAIGDELDRLDQAALISALNKTANYTVTQADVTSLIRMNTAGGNLTVTLPDITTLTDDFDVIVAKVSADNNVVTITRSGTDTINGASSYALTNQWQGAWLTADRSTGTWTVIASGGGGVKSNVDTFTGTGTAGPFTLSGDPGIKENTAVYVGGVYQQKSTYTLVGTSLTVGGNVPAGVSVEVVWAAPLQVGITSASQTTANDGSSGSLFTTVQGFITRLLSSVGSAMVGFIQAGAGAVARFVQDKLRDQVSVLDFNVDPTGATECATGLQAAITYAASVGAILDAPRKSTFLIGSGLAIPSGFMANFKYSTIKRQTGSVFNMLSNTNGTGIRIKNLVVDGNRQADGRVATNVGDRFGGIVFSGVTFSELRNVQVNNTVNAEDGRAGVYLLNCTNVDLYNVGGQGNDRSCVYIENGAFNRIFGSYTKDNLGSGVTSQNANDCEYYDCLAVNSGYSGISINGKRSKGRNLRATGTAAGYAGVNIGHDDALNRADDSIIENVHSYDNLGWGVLVAGSARVQLRGVYTKGNTNHNLQVGFNSSACMVSGLTSTGSGASGVIYTSGKGHKIQSAEIFGNAYYGVDVESGCSVAMTSDVRAYNNCTADNTLAGILLNNAVDSTVEAECFDDQGTKTQGYGIWLVGGSGNMISGYLHDLKTAPIRESSSPVYTTRNMRTGSDTLSGTFTAGAGVTSVTVNNNNARAGMVVLFYPVNSAGAALGMPRLSTITAGTSFVANLGGTAVGTEGYGYVIM